MEAAAARNSPDVSVVVATRNCAAVVERCIESVAMQQGVAVELLIADGGSTDGTADICRRNAPRLAYFHSQPDAGVYDAWNKLLPHARSRWFCFLGADDRLPTSDTLARLMQAAADRPAGCRLVYGRVHYFNAEGECVYREGRPWDEARATMRAGNAIPHIATLHQRSIFDEGARFATQYRIAGDYELLRREALERGAYFADVVAAHAGWGGLSTRPDRQWQCIREVGQIIRAQDCRRPPALWYLRCGNVLLRTAIYRTLGQPATRAYDRMKRWAKGKVLSTEC